MSLHRQHFHAVMHRSFCRTGFVGRSDPCNVSRFDEQSTSCYWDTPSQRLRRGSMDGAG